jgi:hypothetical protein
VKESNKKKSVGFRDHQSGMMRRSGSDELLMEIEGRRRER